MVSEAWVVLVALPRAGSASLLLPRSTAQVLDSASLQITLETAEMVAQAALAAGQKTEDLRMLAVPHQEPLLLAESI